MRYGPILFVISVTMIAMGDLMLLPALVGGFSSRHDAQPFLDAAAAILLPALLLFAVSRRPDVRLVPRQAFFITTVVWLIAALAGALPLVFHEHMRLTDAFFESMSGITTTGSTVLHGLDTMSPAILLWRSMLQWLGGLGFMLMAIAILPLVGVGGMRLFRSESSDWSEKSLPRTRDIAVRIAWLYLTLTGLCGLAYWAFGMSVFDAINHAMTTLATGGYSTSDQSMGRFGSDGVLWTGTVFMILASLPFVLYLESLRRGIQVFVRDDQVRFFFKMVLTVVVAGAAMLSWQQNLPAWDAVTVVAFNAVSTITTTGFASTDYTLWGEFFVAAFVFLMFTGGCSGSTAGSIKIFRLQIALHLFRIQIKKLIHPNGVFVARLNGERVSDDIVSAMVGFSLAMVLTVVLVTLALTALNVDFMTAMSSAATAITNVGPGVGPLVGPAGNFAALPDAAKWLLAGAMLLGRLELMTVLVLFSRSYWQG